MRAHLTLAVLLAAAAPLASAAEPPPALPALAEQLAEALGPPQDDRRAVALVVLARAPGLAAPLASALDAALSARGYVVTPLRSADDAEGAARAGGQDWLLRVQAGLVPGRRELSAVAELVPAWPSFFLQHRPGARAVPPRLVDARVPADASSAWLAREVRPPGAPFAAIRPFARLPGRVLALAVGEALGPGAPALAAVTPDAVLLLSPAGEVLARRAADPLARRPVRGDGAVVAIADLGGGRIAYQHAGAAAAEVLAVEGGRLVAAGALPMAPLCAGEAGPLYGRFAAGTGLLEDVLSTSVDPAAAPRSDRLLHGVAASPRRGAIAYAALSADLRLTLLGADLAPAGPPVEGVGSGFALADLDGDGTPELVASSADPAAPDRVRVLSARPGAAPLLEGPPVEGALLSGAGGDLTGDGVDDAVLGAVLSTPEGPATQLWLVTGDPRGLEAP